MIKIASKTIAKISYLVIFIISLLLAFYFLLLHGIRLDSLKLPGVELKRLYIKLDKKLILKADYIKIEKNYKKTKTKEQLLSLKMYFKYFKQLFDEIDIKKLAYNNQILSIMYANDKFFLETDDIYLKTKISFQNRDTVSVNIQKLILKDYDSSFSGDIRYDFYNDKIEYNGNFSGYNLKGKLKFTLQNSLLRYYISDVKSSSIKPFMEFLNSKVTIEKEVNSWIYKYITAKSYDIKYLYGIINIKSGEFYPSLIRGSAVAKKVKVQFRKNLPKANIKKLNITLKDNSLKFKLINPTYQNIPLKGSSVEIKRLLTKGTDIYINIITTHKLDKKIKEILKSYKVNLPITQLTSATKANLLISIHFVPYDLKIEGKFETKNSDIKFKNIKFHTKESYIKLDNNLISLKNSNISYKNIFNLYTNGTYDTHTNIYKGDANITKLFIKYGENILLDSNSSYTPLKIDFDKGDIELENLKTRLSFKKDNNIFLINSLKNIYNFSPILKRFHIDNGEIKIATKDFENFSAILSTVIKNQKILLYNNKPIKEFDIAIKTGKKLSLFINKGVVKADIDSKNVKIYTEDISFDLKDFINKKDKDDFSIKQEVAVDAKNATLYLTPTLTIPTDNFTLFIKKDKKIFSSTFKSNQIFYTKDKIDVNIETNYISASYFNKLISHKLFKDGLFKLKIQKRGDTFRGKCFISKTTIKSLKKRGSDYKIDSGEFNFILKDDILKLENIILKNDYSTSKGSGYIDIKNKILYLKLNVTILKDISKGVGSIPLLGYIVLGKDGKITSQVKISGSFDNPKVETDFAKDVIKTPFNIFFRTIKLPFKILLPNTNP